MRKILGFAVFVVGLLLFSIPGFGETKWGLAVVAGREWNSHTDLLFDNTSTEVKVFSLKFTQQLGSSGATFPCLYVNGSSACGNEFSLTVPEKSKGVKFTITGNQGLAEKIWFSVTGDFDGITPETNEINRFVDRVEYSSRLTSRSNLFEFRILESRDAFTAVAILKDSYPSSVSRFDISILDSNGQVVVSVSNTIFDRTQITGFSWQLLAVLTPKEWQEKIGDNFQGTLRVEVKGDPIVVDAMPVGP